MAGSDNWHRGYSEELGLDSGMGRDLGWAPPVGDLGPDSRRINSMVLEPDDRFTELGWADSSMLSCPEGIAVDDRGDVYIADKENQRIRKVEILLSPSSFYCDYSHSFSFQCA